MTSDPNTVPSFSRVEISTSSKAALAFAASQLRLLADELDGIAGQKHGDSTAAILAHHRIKATSQRLRKS